MSVFIKPRVVQMKSKMKFKKMQPGEAATKNKSRLQCNDLNGKLTK